MFSGIGQWISSFQKQMISENSLPQVTFEDIQMILRNRRAIDVYPPIVKEEEGGFDSCKEEPLFITTIPLTFLGSNGKKGNFPLIEGTLPPEREESYINQLLDTLDIESLSDFLVVVYGQNATDKTVIEKARQLSALGFSSVCIYSGGMFEWCLLQDVYGSKEFPIAFGGGGGIVEPLLFKGKRLFMDGM